MSTKKLKWECTEAELKLKGSVVVGDYYYKTLEEYKQAFGLIQKKPSARTVIIRKKNDPLNEVVITYTTKKEVV